MAKVAIKSEKLSPFGGIFSIMELFDSNLSSVIDSTLGMRCRLYGYQYSEIIRSLMSVYFCGGSCIEDVTTHLMYHLSLHPTLRTCSADTILRAIKELTHDNISYTSDTGKTYDFNTADKLNTLLLNCLLSTGHFYTHNAKITRKNVVIPDRVLEATIYNIEESTLKNSNAYDRYILFKS